MPAATHEAYSAREIAAAVDVPVEHVAAVLGGADVFVSHAEAVRVGRQLLVEPRAGSGNGIADDSAMQPSSLFTMFGDSDTASTDRSERHQPLVPLALSSTLHVAALAAVVLIAAFGPAPSARTLATLDNAADMHLVFVATPGPGGGGGGGGRLQPAPAPKALRQGSRPISSPIPARRPPPPIVEAPPPAPPPPPVINAEPLPVVVAPVVAAPADNRDRAGVLQEARAETESHGPGKDGGSGTGTGTGLGPGDGSGIGQGSGGGTGGGPYRPGSGIEPPKLLKEVHADYTEEARHQGISGEVTLEIVVRRDGTVGDVRLVRGLGGGLNARAVDAVRQWRFAPARRQGTPVDVIVEVGVEFRLR